MAGDLRFVPRLRRLWVNLFKGGVESDGGAESDRVGHYPSLIERVMPEIRPYSMVPDDAIAFAITQCLDAIAEDLPGDIVECGTWRGGASFAMLLAQRYHLGRIVKPVWMLDSFDGLPPADPERDGPTAVSWQKLPPEQNYDNCRATLPEVQAAVDRFGFREYEAIVTPGWFAQTLPRIEPELRERSISLLRIDCDWYEPVLHVLTQLGPLVSNGAVIILDDYFSWRGCARATHEFLAAAAAPYRIHSLRTLHNAYLFKYGDLISSGSVPRRAYPPDY